MRDRVAAVARFSTDKIAALILTVTSLNKLKQNSCGDVVLRHQLGRLLQEQRVGPVGGAGAEVREVLPVLFAAVPRHQVQHHDPPQDALLHRQPHPAVRRHLLRDALPLLHARPVRREDHHGYDVNKRVNKG